MAHFHNVPVVEVHNENLTELWPSLLLAMNSSTFIALDAELSGLGDRKRLNAKSVDIRYKEICDVAKTRSVISLGLSCFKLKQQSESETKKLHFQVQTFNITLLCSENYIVEPLSLKFLVEHGFDFNKQYAKGIPYYRGPDRENDKDYQSVRQLFTELVLCNVPVVLHNALVDLVFLYQNFYTDTPASMQKFTADLSEIFAGGIFDTKYISEFKSRMPASYLEYIFRKSQRDNRDNAENGKKHVALSFLTYPECMTDVVMLPCGLDDQPHQSQVGKTTPCFQFAAHGWCSKGNHCEESHDIDCILDTESKRKKKKNKKKQKQTNNMSDDTCGHNPDNASSGDGASLQAMNTNFDNGIQSLSDNEREQSMDTSFDRDARQKLVTCVLNQDMDSENIKRAKVENDDKSECERIQQTTVGASETNEQNCEIEHGTVKIATEQSKSNARRTGGHRAGYDSFMTGFAFACTVAHFGTMPKQDPEKPEITQEFGLHDIINKVALGGKDIPLLIQKSNFAKTSAMHNDKIQKLKAMKKS